MNPNLDRETTRLQVTRAYPVAQRGVDAALSESCRLAALVCHCRMAAVELVLDEWVVLAAAVGVKGERIARADALSPDLLDQRKVVVIPDARIDSRFRDRRLVSDPEGVRFYAAAPLISPEGHALGVLSVSDTEVGDLTASQMESLEGLGRMVMAQLDLGRRQQQLEQLEAEHARVEDALREAEANYRGIFENTVLGVYQTSPDGRYLSANPMLARIYGYRDANELMQSVGDIQMQVYVDPTARDRFIAALQQQDQISNFEAQIRRKDGTILWIAETARVVRDEKGQVRLYEGTVQDITARKLAEDQLRNSEMLYHSLVEELPQNIFRKDRNEKFIFANWRFCETVGCPLERLLGRTDFDLFPPELARKYQADDQRVMADGRTVRETERNVTPDGAIHWVEVIKTPLRDVSGSVTGIQGIFWDVTDRKRLQDALAYERDLLQALLDHSPDVIFFKDPQSRFVKVGRSAARWFNVGNEDDLVGKTLFDLMPAARAQPLHDEEQELLRTGQPIINKVQQYGDSQGHQPWASVTKIPIYDRSGEILGLVGVARDVTQLIETEQALREAEERFRGIFENSVEGIFQTSPEGRFIRVNPALARIYGYSTPEEVMSKLTDVRTQVYVDAGRREEFVRQVLARGSLTGFESEIYRADGTTTWVSESARIVRDREGRLAYFEGTLEDISARKQIETEREKARHAALESVRLKTEFVATVSHEIRTPLNAILPNADFLLQSRLDRQQRYLVENIVHGARMLLQIVNAILDFSKVEAKGVTLEEIDFDLQELIERTVSFFAGRAHEKNLELAGRVGRDVPRQLRGDPARIEQVLNNLIGNAIKFTEKGEVSLEVETVDVQEGSVELLFRVRDTGIGIAPAARSRVFQAFAQGDGSMARRYGGTGLGLAITRRFVELMGGTIDFESELGNGSTFWFTAKLRQPLHPRPDAPTPPVLAGRRILLIEDNASQRAAMADCLATLAPASLEMADSVEDGLARLDLTSKQGGRFDLILFDTELPATDGTHAAHQLRLGCGECDLVAVAPPGTIADESTLKEEGVLGALVKPLRPSKLAAELSAVLAGQPDEPLPVEPPATTEPKVGEGLNVLVVDDNDINHRVVREMLARLGARADAVSSGTAAIEAFQQGHYDLILMDCQMPGMDGYEATRRLRRLEADSGSAGRSKTVPIVAVSANALEEDREQGLRAGMNDYLTKPLRLADLERILREAVGSGGSDGSGGSGRSVVADDVVLDPDPLLSVTSPDDPTVLEGFVAQFLEEAPRRIERLEAAAASRDAGVLRAEAHSLKGNASYMGVRRLVKACSTLEVAARDGDLSHATDLAARVRSEFEQASAALIRHLQTVTRPA